MSTLRQQIAVKKLSEIIGNSKGQKNISIGRILKEAGYSDETAKTPQLVTESKGFREEMDNAMPDKKLVDTHEKLFRAVNINKIEFDQSISDIQIKKIIEGDSDNKIKGVIRTKNRNKIVCYYWSPDRLTRIKAIDMGYKIKNLYQTKEEAEQSTPKVIYITQYGEIIDKKQN